jgi:hypothetical protein
MDNSTTSGGPPLGAGPPLPPPDQYKVETSVFGFAISMTILSAIAVIARFYTRGIIRKVIGAEDYCILVAFVRTYRTRSFVGL